MNTVQRIAKNTGILLIAQVGGYLLAFFYMMYAARYLGPANFGILSFALAFTGIFGVFTDLGLRPLTVREVARDKSLALKYLSNVSLMKIILGAIAFALLFLTIKLMGYPEQTIRVVYLLGLSVIFQGFTQMFYSIFQAYEKMEFQALGRMLNAALMLAGVMVAIKLRLGVLEFALLYTLVGFVILIYSFVALKWKFSNPALAWSPRMVELDWSFWKPTMKEALPFGLAIVFATVFYWIDSVMLSYMKGNEVVGWYGAAYRMVRVLLFVPAAFNAAIFPIMSRFYTTSPASLKLSYEKYFKYMAILGIPIGVGTTLLAPRFIMLIFGAEYANSIIALQILVWSSVFIVMSGPFGRLFESSNRQMLVTKILGFCMVLNVISNLIFIPKYGYIAASATTVATEFTSLALCFICSAKIGYSLFNRNSASIITKVLASSALMGAFIISFYNLTLLVLVPAAVVLYFAVLYVIRTIDKKDMSLVRRVVGRRNYRCS